MIQGYLGADPDRLDALGHHVLGKAQLLDELRETFTAQLYQTDWSGPDADASRAAWEIEHAPAMGTAAMLLRAMSNALATHAAQQRAASAAESGGTSTAPPATSGTRGDRGDRGDPDGRGGRRLDNDEIFRRPEGGRGDGWLSNDWAGRAILDRYLGGGADWTIVDDPDWSRYMMGNQSLSEQLADPIQGQAQAALDTYLSGGGRAGAFDQTFHAEIENGEGVVGYQYLHGTNSDVGGFNFSGTTTVTPRPDGTYEVTVHGGYTWNDVIDPNPIYDTDRWKSAVAEAITLGRADPYDIHITWHAESKVILDAQGNVMSIEGYPAS